MKNMTKVSDVMEMILLVVIAVIVVMAVGVMADSAIHAQVIEWFKAIGAIKSI